MDNDTASLNQIIQLCCANLKLNDRGVLEDLLKMCFHIHDNADTMNKLYNLTL